jgi:hypothetical protein
MYTLGVTPSAGGGPWSFPSDLPVEDQADPVRAAGVEVVADDVLEEHPPAHGLVEHLGQGELSLEDRDLIAVPRITVGVGQRPGQACEPLVQQRLDLLRPQLLTQGLQPGRVLDSSETVVQRGEGDPLFLRLTLRPLMPINTQPGIIRKIGTRLQEERTEVGIHRIHVEVIDHTRGLHNPRIRHTLGVTTLLRPEQHRLLLSPPDE